MSRHERSCGFPRLVVSSTGPPVPRAAMPATSDRTRRAPHGLGRLSPRRTVGRVGSRAAPAPRTAVSASRASSAALGTFAASLRPTSPRISCARARAARHRNPCNRREENEILDSADPQIAGAVAGRHQSRCSVFPPFRLSPRRALSRPHRILVSVVLPAQFGPRNAWSSPRFTLRRTPSSAVLSRNRRDIPRTSIAGPRPPSTRRRRVRLPRVFRTEGIAWST